MPASLLAASSSGTSSRSGSRTARRESYRYHHLFQAFLRGASPRPSSRGARGPAPARGARAGSRGRARRRGPHLLAAGDHAAAADALEPVAETLVTSPQAQTLVGWLDAMPRESWAERPSLMTAHAALLLIRGEHEASFAEFERAVDRLLELGDHERAAAALLRLLQSMITAGTRPGRRIEAGERYIGRIGPEARALPSARILLASSYAYACDFERATRELQEALALPGAEGQPVLGVYAAIVGAYYIRAQVGQLEEAVLALDEAIADLERHEEQDELAFMPYARMFRVYLLNDLGRHDDAFPEIRRTQDAAARRGMARTHRRVVAWIRGVALAGSGRWDELEREIAPPERAPGQPRADLLQLPLPRHRRPVGGRAWRGRRREEPRRGGARGDGGVRAGVRQADGPLRPRAGGPPGRRRRSGARHAAEARAHRARDRQRPGAWPRACMHAATGAGRGGRRRARRGAPPDGAVVLLRALDGIASGGWPARCWPGDGARARPARAWRPASPRPAAPRSSASAWS